MLKQIMVTILGLFLFSGCSDGFREYFKKSANNKIIDTKGFDKDKRRPLYNKKYISLAKRNVIEENFDDDEDELSEMETETINPSLRNRQMYLKMVKKDEIRRQQRYDNDENISLNEASRRVKEDDNRDAKLQRDLEQIKSMLNEAKKDLVKYRCPTQQDNKDNEILSGNLRLSNTEKNGKINNEKNESKMSEKFLIEDDDSINVNSMNNNIDGDYIEVESENLLNNI